MLPFCVFMSCTHTHIQKPNRSSRPSYLIGLMGSRGWAKKVSSNYLLSNFASPVYLSYSPNLSGCFVFVSVCVCLCVLEGSSWVARSRWPSVGTAPGWGFMQDVILLISSRPPPSNSETVYDRTLLLYCAAFLFCLPLGSVRESKTDPVCAQMCSAVLLQR